jgi:uncharacterized membrane protein
VSVGGTALEGRLRLALGAVAVAGLAVSGYLTAVRASGGTPACAIATGCAQVQQSAYSEVAGVPVAVLGLLAYAVLLATAILAREAARIGGLFTALVGAGFSGWLTYVEIGIIDAVCLWCVVSASLMAIAVALTATRVWLSGASAREVAPAAEVSERPLP